MDLFTLLIIFSGLMVGWSIGSNDAANCLGTSVGAGLIDYKKASWLVAVLVFVGASLQGKATMHTVGKGIVNPALLTGTGVIAALLTASLLVILFTFFRLPVSTTQAVVGGIAGISFMLKIETNWYTVVKIFALGFGTALISLVFAYFIYKLYIKIFSKKSFLFVEKMLGWLVLLSGAFLAYSLGANNIGNAMGLVFSKGAMTVMAASVAGGLAISIGSVTLGKRVMKTISNDITMLNAPMAFTAQLSAAFSVYILTLFGVPTSITFSIVGGVAGVGLVKSFSSVQYNTVKKILVGWVLTPVISAIAAPLTLMLLNKII